MPGTANPSANDAIFRKKASTGEDSDTGNGFAEDFAYDSAADTFTAGNIVFDGEGPYTAVRDGAGDRFGIGPFSIFVSSTNAQSAGSVNVAPQELRLLAANAIVNGQPAQGYQMAQALLAHNPNDTEALIIRARAARDLGRLPEALTTARKAWSGAQNASERFVASMVMAQTLSTSGAKTRAQLWLCRAAQNASSKEFKQVAVHDFCYVQRTNPWSTERSFSASPSSNINNGSTRTTTRLFDLPFEFQLSGTARALSGIRYNAGITTRY